MTRTAPPMKLALPAHGHPFTNLEERAQSIKAHHHERLEEIDEIARELGRADVNSFMKRLFRERSRGDMAESETYAHLEHLRMAGKAAAFRHEQGRLVYELECERGSGPGPPSWVRPGPAQCTTSTGVYSKIAMTKRTK